MTDVTIYAHALLAVTGYAPPHGMLHLSPHAMRLRYLPVTGSAIDPGADVWLVREKHVCRAFNPINAGPRRLLAALGYSGELLHLRLICFDWLVTRHARWDVWDRRIAGLVWIFMAEITFELSAFFFSDVLPMIEFDRLDGRFDAAKGSKQYEPAYEHQRHQKHKDFSESFH
jgi:hypothetical protein